MEHFAVIDLGTNTFHILIVKKTSTHWDEVYRKRVFVNIAEHGIETLGADCYRRGMETIVEFHEELVKLEVKQVSVFGTAALRTASNGATFRSEVKNKTGLTIEIIDGRREASLIAKGTKAIVDMAKGNYLIMDIGGGSVEFILVQDVEETYIESFPIGITSLYNKLPHGEPISRDEIAKINEYLDEQLKPLKNKLNDISIEGLIGASGSYEVLEKIITGNIAERKASRFDITDINKQIDHIIKMDLSERLQNPSIPKQRAKLIVVAVILMKHVLNITSFKSMIISPYAIKEGALLEMMNLD